MKNILVAGATGYLGNFILEELKKKKYKITAIARNPDKLKNHSVDQVIQAEVTQPETLDGICSKIDCIISTIGITRQKDGLTYMDVDYQANVNLLEEAEKNNVKKFVYVSVLNGQLLRDLKMVAAKERFVEKLKSSSLDYVIIRPNGFFSDMTEVLNMARRGPVYLFGSGEYQGNPVHGADLAEFIVLNLERRNVELEVGGPQILSQQEIAQSAFNALGKKVNIMHIPLWIRDLMLKLIRWFSTEKTYGPLEFFMTVMTLDMIAPQYGYRRLSDYYREIVK